MYESEESATRPRFNLAQAILGFALGILAPFCIILIAMAIPPAPGNVSYTRIYWMTFYTRIWMIFGIGFVQWIYVVPLFLVFRNFGRKSLAAGLVIAAFILLLLNLAVLADLARHPFNI